MSIKIRMKVIHANNQYSRVVGPFLIKSSDIDLSLLILIEYQAILTCTLSLYS